MAAQGPGSFNQSPGQSVLLGRKASPFQQIGSRQAVQCRIQREVIGARLKTTVGRIQAGGPVHGAFKTRCERRTAASGTHVLLPRFLGLMNQLCVRHQNHRPRRVDAGFAQ